MKVGVEVGGTFTDLISLGSAGLVIEKVPSVPDAPEKGAMAALHAAGSRLEDLVELVHGSTVATNAVLERKGAPMAFLVTAGFRDILYLQRHDRRSVYDLHYAKPQPPVKRRDCFEVKERMGSDGEVLTALDEQHFLREVLPALKAGKYSSVAVCLLNSYANPTHEMHIEELLARHIPQVPVAVSSLVTREFREFERASTTAVSGYIQPIVDQYIARFQKTLCDDGFGGRFSIMQSNGGRLPSSAARKTAIGMLLSGPAAGVVGAVRQAARSGCDNIITFDMGGTSTDVCLVTDGQPQLTSDFDIDGLPIRSPILDIVTVGAGGGSLIWQDEGGMLRVGPRSAGAVPGPVCYGRGGSEPTITDAHVVRGVLREKAFLGGKMALDVPAAQRSVALVAEMYDQSAPQFAASAIRLANANIVRAIQLVSTERGYDPGDFVLVPFGGAGPLHACEVADELGIDKILVPPHAGVLSAYGLLASDYVHFESRTQRIVARDDDTLRELREAITELEATARRKLQDAGLTEEATVSVAAAMRSVGQAFEIDVPVPFTDLATLTVADLRNAFRKAHQKVFFHDLDPERDVEVVALRLRAAVADSNPPLLSNVSRNSSVGGQVETVTIDEGRTSCSVYDRSALPPGFEVAGPAIIDEPTTTTLIPGGWSGVHDDAGNLMITRS